MDTDKWQSVATVRALIAELRRIHQGLESLHEEIKQHRETIRTAYERQEQQRQQLPIPLKVELEENQEGKRQTEGERQYAVQKSIRNAAWAAFVAAIFYASITGITLNEIRKQTPAVRQSADAATQSLATIQKQFQQEQRPYIAIVGFRVLGK